MNLDDLNSLSMDWIMSVGIPDWVHTIKNPFGENPDGVENVRLYCESPTPEWFEQLTTKVKELDIVEDCKWTLEKPYKQEFLYCNVTYTNGKTTKCMVNFLNP